jgi:hypothetical protein
LRGVGAPACMALLPLLECAKARSTMAYATSIVSCSCSCKLQLLNQSKTKDRIHRTRCADCSNSAASLLLHPRPRPPSTRVPLIVITAFIRHMIVHDDRMMHYVIISSRSMCAHRSASFEEIQRSRAHPPMPKDGLGRERTIIRIHELDQPKASK